MVNRTLAPDPAILAEERKTEPLVHHEPVGGPRQFSRRPAQSKHLRERPTAGSPSVPPPDRSRSWSVAAIAASW